MIQDKPRLDSCRKAHGASNTWASPSLHRVGFKHPLIGALNVPTINRLGGALPGYLTNDTVPLLIRNGDLQKATSSVSRFVPAN